MKYKLLILFLLFFTIKASAQENNIIKAKVLDTRGELLEGAVVQLFKVEDSIAIANTFTDTLGIFTFESVINGIYRIQIQYLGLQDYLVPKVSVGNGKTVDLGSLYLEENEKLLEGVTVTAKRPLIEKLVDRTVVNVDALLSNAGNNALEVLKKSPGVQVNDRGAILLQGKSGVTVYIDDKPTYLSGTDLMAYLESLPASALNTIELMGNPPAKYEAAGNSGVINIRLKRSKQQGFKGNLNVAGTHGRHFRSNNSANLNWNKNKLSIYTTLVFNKNSSFQDLNLNRSYFNQDGSLSSTFAQHSLIRNNAYGPRLRLGMDYQLNKKSNIGFSIGGFSWTEKDSVTNHSLIKNGQNELLNIVDAKSKSNRRFNNVLANLNYQYKIDSLGSNLSFNADYLNYNSNLKNGLLNTVNDANGHFLNQSNLLGYLPSKINIVTTNGDYEQAINAKSKLSVGYKIAYVTTDNIANFYDEENGNINVNDDFSNRFKYKENINAAYVNYNTNRGRWSVQAGLRLENTNINGHQIGDVNRVDTAFKRNINSLFPTVYVSYHLDSAQKHLLNFSYGRRIDRPNYQDMNPFSYPLDRYTIYGGNPYLKPTFSNNIELSYTYNNWLTGSVIYSLINDLVAETIEQNNGMFFSRPGNIGKQQMYGASLSASANPLKFWTLNFYGLIHKNKFDATLYGQSLDNSGWNKYVSLSNQFQISKSFAAEISGNYTARAYYAQFVLIPTGSLDISFSKKILKDKASLKLSCSDLFYTNIGGGTIIGLNASDAYWKNRGDSRAVTVAFTYNFQKGNQVREQKSTGANEERNRVK